MEKCRAVPARFRAGVLLLVALLCLPGLGAAASRTYTTDADFDEGVLTGLQHDTVPDQLQLTVEPKMMPFIWMPNNGQGTISKVNTDTGQEVGRYRISPHEYSMPSRTTVDLRGDCWVGVRQAGTVVKIGLYEAGEWIDRNSDGICQTSYDANADGDITGDELLPWGADECVLFEVVLVPGYEGSYVPGTYTGPYDYEYWGVAPRSLAVDAENNLWAGTWSTSKFYYVDGSTGAIMRTVDVSPWGHNAYGAVTDRNGVIWSSSLNGSHVLKLDPRTNPPTITRVDFGRAVYGVGVDYLGHLFATHPYDPCGLSRVNIDTNEIEWTQDKPEINHPRGVVCTADNDVWLGNSNSNNVTRYDNDGNLKATIPANVPSGVAVDTAGKVWVCDLGDDYIHRIDPATNEIELSKAILGSGGHYTYSDMTGVISWSVTSKQGLWTVTYDSGAAASPWGTVSWHGEEPEGSSIAVEVRSSENQEDWSGWELALNGNPFVVTPNGRYLQVRVALETSYGAAGPPVLYDLTIRNHPRPLRTLSHSSFERSLHPWATFAAGPGAANTWRRALTSDPLAHSGIYAASAEVEDEGLTGLVLRLPVEPTGAMETTLRAWVYLADRTVGDASTFVGLSFADTIGESLSDMTPAFGWRVDSATTSTLYLYDSQESLSLGLATGAWHLVQLQHTRDTHHFQFWLDGILIRELAVPPSTGHTATFALLCASGLGASARQQAYFDDVSVLLVGHPRPTATRPFALLDLRERVVQGATVPYTLQYGNGYPMLGLDPITSTLSDSIYVGLSLPAGYALSSAAPAPTRTGSDGPIWELPMPAQGQAGLINLEAVVPTGAAEPVTDRMWAWATAAAGAETTDPPSPPGVTVPPDAVWGAPQDLLPQRIELGPQPDLWVRKQGPRFASPGDTVDYAITVGNCGDVPAANVVVRDLVPDLLGNGDRIVGNLASLAPGDIWTGILSGTLPWGIPGGALVLNTAYTPTAPSEAATANNTAVCTTTIQAAHDPNEIVNSPFGGCDRGQLLTYMLLCENTGVGTAYGVYATCELASGLDASTLRVSSPALMRYDPVSRTLVWDIGELTAGQGASAWLTLRVAGDARRARPVVEQAVIYFPSVPETTPTRIVYNVVNSTFSDIAWNHWAILPIEQTYEATIVGGYPDGTYRPTLTVTRDQMGVYMARALAGGDASVPDGPATPTFTDVDPAHWAYKYIEYAAESGVIGGYGDGTYRPGLTVDRGQMAVFIARAVAGGDSLVPTAPPTATFPDVAPGTAWEWAWKYVEYTVSRGVVGGYGDGTYRPAVVCTRDQMAVFVTRAFALPS